MKNISFNIVLIVVIVCQPFNAISQTLNKKLLVGGQYDLNFSSYKTSYKGPTNSFTYNNYKTFSISPLVGYLVTTNLAFGVEIPYNYNKTSNESSISRSSAILIQPFVRYYIGNKKVKPYLLLSLGPGWQKTGSADFGWPETTQKTKLFKYQFKGGLSFFVNEFICFDFNLGYRSLTTFFKEPMVNGSYNEWKVLNKGMEAAIGLTVFL